MFPLTGPCCCGTACVCREHQPDATYDWSSTEEDALGSFAQCVAFDGSGNAYLQSKSRLTQIDSSGAVVWRGNALTELITAICIDDANGVGYFGTNSHDVFGTPANVYKFDLSDGSLIVLGNVGSTAGYGRLYVSDIVLDVDDNPVASLADTGTRDGIILDSGRGGVFRLDASDLSTLQTIGCARDVTGLATDTSFNLYAVGPASCSTTIGGCTAYWNVIKYDDAGVLVTGNHLYRALSCAWYGSKVFVSYDGRITKHGTDAAGNILGTTFGNDEFCNLVALDDTTLRGTADDAGCLWTLRLGQNAEPADAVGRLQWNEITDLAADSQGVYAVADEWLFKVSHAGSFQWCRKNAAEDDAMVLKTGNYRGVAADGSVVWVVGDANPCVEGTDDTCEHDTGTEDRCTCECEDTDDNDIWNTGKDGGFLVDGCGCLEVPCSVTMRMTPADCLDGWPTEFTMTRQTYGNTHGHSAEWDGGFNWDCGDDSWHAAFQAFYDCGDGWSLDVTISKLTGSPVSPITFHATIGDSFCEGEDGHPGFDWTLAIAGEDFTNLGLTECCTDGVTICGSAGGSGDCPAVCTDYFGFTSFSDSGGEWSNTGNGTSCDGSFVEDTLPALLFDTTTLVCTTPTGLSVPSGATIVGVKVKIKGRGDQFTESLVELSGAGTSSNKATHAWTSTNTEYLFGGDSDVWGATVTDTIVNTGALGVNLKFSHSGSGNRLVEVDCVQIAVCYTT